MAGRKKTAKKASRKSNPPKEVEEKSEAESEPKVEASPEPEVEEPKVEEKPTPKKNTMRMFASDIEAVFKLAESAGLSADQKQSLRALLDAGVTEKEFAEIQKELRSTAVRRAKLCEKVEEEGRAGKYRLKANIRIGERNHAAGELVQLDKDQSRHYMRSGAVEPV